MKRKIVGEKTLLYFNCYLDGMSIQEIAEKQGVSYRAVTGLIERTKNKKCKYSESCFSCPLKDCVIDSEYACFVNLIESDIKAYSKEYISRKRERLGNHISKSGSRRGKERYPA